MFSKSKMKLLIFVLFSCVTISCELSDEPAGKITVLNESNDAQEIASDQSDLTVDEVIDIVEDVEVLECGIFPDDVECAEHPHMFLTEDCTGPRYLAVSNPIGEFVSLNNNGAFIPFEVAAGDGFWHGVRLHMKSRLHTTGFVCETLSPSVYWYGVEIIEP